MPLRGVSLWPRNPPREGVRYVIMDEKVSSTKKAWVTPTLDTLGTVERLTQQNKCKEPGGTDDLGSVVSTGTAC
jgi:hypothetical protein